jgi:hypothetical protein
MKALPITAVSRPDITLIDEGLPRLRGVAMTLEALAEVLATCGD